VPNLDIVPSLAFVHGCSAPDGASRRPLSVGIGDLVISPRNQSIGSPSSTGWPPPRSNIRVTWPRNAAQVPFQASILDLQPGRRPLHSHRPAPRGLHRRLTEARAVAVRRVLSSVLTEFCDDEWSYVVHVDVRGAVAFDCECASAAESFLDIPARDLRCRGRRERAMEALPLRARHQCAPESPAYPLRRMNARR
jgi:hypothetical protein